VQSDCTVVVEKLHIVYQKVKDSITTQSGNTLEAGV